MIDDLLIAIDNDQLINSDQLIDSDPMLFKWLKSRFENEKVIVYYQDKEKCTVPRNNLVTSQVVLPDKRLLRCDWASPTHKGEKGCNVVSVERLASIVPAQSP